MKVLKDLSDSKKSLHGRGWRFQCREFGRKFQRSGVAARCLLNRGPCGDSTGSGERSFGMPLAPIAGQSEDYE
jgi:hypothetical protein